MQNTASTGGAARVRIKICGVTNVADALMAAGAGASAIGLNFFPGSPRFVPADTAEEIVACLPASVCRVGVFVDAQRAEIEALARRLDLGALQFHGSEDQAFCRGWQQKVIKAVRVRHARSLHEAARYPVDFILADAYVEGVVGGTGRRVPSDWLSGVSPNRLILAGGLTPENIAEAVRKVRPAGVDVASGVEQSPGRKDPKRVEQFITAAQQA